VKLRTNQPLLTGFAAISLTDIVFLLLVFFLLSSTFFLQLGIKVRLPESVAGDISSERSIVLSVAFDRTIYLNDESFTRPMLIQELRQRLVDPNQIIVLRADRRLPLEAVVDVMDLARSAGWERFLIATESVRSTG
jgi:biopolymer transport protein ExbD